jgi:peptidoglycan/xylan/chitin deacetylase (PgdA/CDA1 family)
MRDMGCWLFAFFVAGGMGTVTSASAAVCNGKTDALGVGRAIAVDPKEHTRVGTMQYPETLPLADHEVVISFDDGPSPRYTDRILDILSAECVKAVFFMVGAMTKTFPADARRVYAEGHTIGTHSFHHPFTFGKMSEEQAGAEIDLGIDAVATALGDPTKVAPFFRVPGFLTSKSTEAALASRGLMTWSADFPADDWKGIGSSEIAKRAISRLEAKGRGVLVLHDIHQQTVQALPIILNQLKLGGYKIVQIVPANETVAKTETTPEQWKLSHEHNPATEQGAAKQALSSAEKHRSDASKVKTMANAEHPSTVKQATAKPQKTMVDNLSRMQAHHRHRS